MARALKLGRKTGHRKSLLKNLVTSLVLYERIKTTEAKSRLVVPTFSRLVKVAKEGDLNARRALNKFFPVREASAKMIESIAPRFKDSTAGFLRIFKIRPRKGDNAPMVILEFTIPPQKDKKDEKQSPKKEARSSD